jgi:hypothetical protein
MVAGGVLPLLLTLLGAGEEEAMVAQGAASPSSSLCLVRVRGGHGCAVGGLPRLHTLLSTNEEEAMVAQAASSSSLCLVWVRRRPWLRRGRPPPHSARSG